MGPKSVSPVLVLLMAFSLLSPTVASAMPGDSWRNAVPMAVPSSQAGTLTPGLDFEGGEFFYSVPMVAGETIVVTSTVAPWVPFSDATAFDPFSKRTQDGVLSTTLAHGVSRLVFMATHTQSYAIWLVGHDVATFTVQVQAVPPVDFRLSQVSVPSKLQKRKAFKVSVTLTPKYDALAAPIWIPIERMVGTVWTRYSSATMLTPRVIPAFGKAWGTMKLPKGMYRIRAKFSDAAHPNGVRGPWRTIVVR